MDYIFEDGFKLYLKRNKQVNNSQEDPTISTIYGDDFKIKLVPRNIVGDFSMRITDYDENQNEECNISIGFNKTDLLQYISLLTDIANNMEEGNK